MKQDYSEIKKKRKNRLFTVCIKEHAELEFFDKKHI